MKIQWMRYWTFGLLLLLALPLAAQDTPRVEPADCWFTVAEGQAVECQYVIVPENRTDPDSDEIRLAVAVFKASDEDPQPDPVMILSGGPGEKTVENAPLAAQALGSQYPDRDVIFFDQRGVGLSEPALECPEWTDAVRDLLDELDPVVALQEQFDALVVCQSRLMSEGYDLNGYNTTQNAADVNDIRQALGYETLNLLGVSYGSLLAQVVMREHPEAVRSVVLDSVLPTDASFFVDTSTTATLALTQLIEACAADAACNTAYPDLQNVLFNLIDELNANPVPLRLADPLSGQQYDSYLTGDAVLGNLTVFLYFAPLLPQLPQVIYNVAEGDYTLMTQLSSIPLAALNVLSRGMMFTVFCSEDLVGRGPEDYLEAILALPPQFRGQMDPEDAVDLGFFAICENWPVTPVDAAFKLPVESDLPTLLLAGEFDPVTPPYFAERVAQTLENSYLYEFPAVGHSVSTSSECAQAITAAFIADPTTQPDAACLAEAPALAFDVGDEAPAEVSVDFTPFTSADGSYTTVVPEGWTEAAPGVFARGESLTDPTALVLVAAPVPPADFLQAAAQQLGVETLESTTSIEANGLTWEMYEVVFQNYPTLMAITGNDSQTYTVQLVTQTKADRIALGEAVVLPMLEAFTLVE